MTCLDSQSNGQYGMRRGSRVAWDQEGGHWCPSSHFLHNAYQLVVQVFRSRIDSRFADGTNVDDI
jgi:hypothetical protein